jgi:hypothetical protein
MRETRRCLPHRFKSLHRTQVVTVDASIRDSKPFNT